MFETLKSINNRFSLKFKIVTILFPQNSESQKTRHDFAQRVSPTQFHARHDATQYAASHEPGGFRWQHRTQRPAADDDAGNDSASPTAQHAPTPRHAKSRPAVARHAAPTSRPKLTQQQQ